MNNPLFVGIILIFISLIPLGLGLFYLKWLHDLQKNGVQTIAIISKFTLNNVPIFNYSINNVEVLEQKYRFAHTFMRIIYKEKESYSIKYNPNNPKSFWVEGDKSPWIFIGGAFLGFLINLLMAMVLLFTL